MKGWSISQSCDIKMQLEKGIRFIDMRALWDGKDWVTHHCLIGEKISSLLEDIKSFLNENVYFKFIYL